MDWIPMVGEPYYHVSDNSIILKNYWDKSLYDLSNYYCGNCFKTEQDALANKDDVVLRLNEAYDMRASKYGLSMLQRLSNIESQLEYLMDKASWYCH